MPSTQRICQTGGSYMSYNTKKLCFFLIGRLASPRCMSGCSKCVFRIVEMYTLMEKKIWMKNIFSCRRFFIFKILIFWKKISFFKNLFFRKILKFSKFLIFWKCWFFQKNREKKYVFLKFSIFWFFVFFAFFGVSILNEVFNTRRKYFVLKFYIIFGPPKLSGKRY